MEGFGFAQDDKGRSHRIPQTGKVVIEDNVLMGSQCNVDRATWVETRIRAGSKFDALCHVAHNADIGEDCIIVAQTGVAGSSTLGKRVIVSGQSAITDHVSITDDVILVQRAGVINDIDKPGVYAGTPVQPVKDYFRNSAVAHKLVELRKQVRKLEKQVADLIKE
jgi:UDP-3-O-[3-hydroxymyristoyl] glucosamine N-acyltransferase